MENVFEKIIFFMNKEIKIKIQQRSKKSHDKMAHSSSHTSDIGYPPMQVGVQTCVRYSPDEARIGEILLKKITRNVRFLISFILEIITKNLNLRSGRRVGCRNKISFHTIILISLQLNLLKTIDKRSLYTGCTMDRRSRTNR